MTFYCPTCRDAREGGDAVNGMVQCPQCTQWVEWVETPDPIPDPTPAPTPKSKPYPTESASSLRNIGDNFAVFAVLFCVVGLLVLLISVFQLFNDGGSLTGVIVGAGLIGAALWLYLIAQIVHIRANTLK